MARLSRNARLAGRVGARLRALRLGANLTQEKLAWECDLSKPYLSQIEAGKRLPSLLVLGAIAERLGIDVLDMLAVDVDRPLHRLLDAVRTGNKKAVQEALRALRIS